MRRESEVQIMEHYTTGKHPNSLANLAKSYGGRGGFDTDGARKARTIQQVNYERRKALERYFKGMTPEALELDRVLAELEAAKELHREALIGYYRAKLRQEIGG
jgi:hypothetical protein